MRGAVARNPASCRHRLASCPESAAMRRKLGASGLPAQVRVDGISTTDDLWDTSFNYKQLAI